MPLRADNNLTDACRVESSDVSLCVLSSPDVFTESGDIRIPTNIEPLIKEDTFILFNKIDLSRFEQPPSLPSRASWAVSLQTGEGLQAFMVGLGAALQHRYVLLLL